MEKIQIKFVRWFSRPLPGDKGYENERKIRNVLKRLKRNKNEIRDFLSSTYSEDFRGIDFDIVYVGKMQYYRIPLQVKSSRAGQEKHIRSHPEIPSIRVAERSMAILEEKIMQIIENYVYFDRTIHK